MVVAISILALVPHGEFWWWSFLIPAFALIGASVGEYLRWKEIQRQQILLDRPGDRPVAYQQAFPQAPHVSSPTTSELAKPSSGAEHATRHLEYGACLTSFELRGYFSLFLKVHILLQGVTTLAKGRATTAQIRKTDPLMEQYLHTSAWVKERSRPIVQWLAIGVGVIALAAVVWWFFSHRAKNAADSMAKAMAAHQAIVQNPLPTLVSGQIAFKTEDEKHREAYKAFAEAANEYPSYNGETARYFAAVHQLHFEADKAEATLKELAQKNSDVGAQARMALAQRYEASGRNDEAIAEYQKLKAGPGPIPAALIDLSMARVYEAMGKKTEAADLYFAVASNKDLRTSEVGSTAVDRLAAIAPEKVDQLPPPEPSGMRFPGGGLPFN